MHALSRISSTLPQRRGSQTAQDRSPAAPGHASPGLNTILAVREHAPAEIGELDAEIRSLHCRLVAAHARKRLLEALLAVIREADAATPPGPASMSVVR